MPLRNDLLNPVSPDNPAGDNLRYAPVYDKIKEARREEDDVPQGDWKYERKQADWPTVIKLASETIATKSKDLQLGAWLTEAMLHREGIPGLRESLEMLRGLVENFWEGLHPEIEDGDVEYRAAPLQWVGDRLEMPIKRTPLTKGRYDWYQYRESRTVPTEQEASEYGGDKTTQRQEMLAEGKLAPEVFDKDFDETPKSFYESLEATYDQTLESLAQLSQVCDEKFGDVAPSFRTMQNVLEEVRLTVHSFLVKKRELEPDAAPAAEPEPALEETGPEEAYGAPAETAAAAAPARARRAMAEPQTWEEAAERVGAMAKFMRAQDATNPAPYLLLRGLRWGEVRAGGGTIDQTKLAAPPTELRQELKRLSLEGSWAEVLEAAETAMAMECGRGWLDIQRYVGRACTELGSYYDPIRVAVISELRSFLADCPGLTEVTMADDTATANAETLAWIKENVGAAPAAAAAPQPDYGYAQPVSAAEVPHAAEDGAPPPPPDAFELAFQAARAGRTQEGIELLMREMMQEPSGRGRFQRKVQVAQLCLTTGNEAIALPLLQEAAAEIERRKLEDWEPREMVAPPLAMLYRCLGKGDGAAEERQRLYTLICRLDPLAAMKLTR